MSKAFGITSLLVILTVATLLSFALLGHNNPETDHFFTAVLIAADSMEAPDLEYVGAQKCRLCHFEIYESWRGTKHARAITLLEGDQPTSPECIRCHSTGIKADGTLIENVECESCHGPGSEYRKMRVMKDLGKAIELGLVVAGETACLGCHNEDSPDFKGFEYTPGQTTGVHILVSSASK
ncbi:MAG: cytochrome c3 family protein [candidate division Zixibacteria bacterium]|nr:cytochrome c3 family protein [candidate division Zixibacteria bacterium]MBU1469460.1 cytochrome c3 family protein [candidate division Zixibacteria bacterium]MBU2624214.1 cytochrome c3 family protein [candidate division Zixibacteria bacterium]